MEEIIISAEKDNRNRVNNQIKAPHVRVIDQNGKQLGVISLREAQQTAIDVGLDLVEIQPNADPPVVRIIDYGKFVFQRNKRRALAKKKQKQVKLKEIKFRPSTDKNDYEVKLRNLRNFLDAGDKVKITVWFRGREMAHQELGLQLLERIKADLADCSKVEYMPKLEGKQLIMILAQKKK